MKRMALLIAILFLAGFRAWGHGNMDHVLGTVVNISGDIVTVEKDGRQTEVYLRPFTKYELAGHAAQRHEVRVGDRVVVHAKKRDGKEEAYELRLMHAAASRAQ